MTHVQTVSELQAHLDEQISFLKSSCDGYDSGRTAEAKRIAHIVRVLVHDTSKSHSLLEQLSLKGAQFLSTRVPMPNNGGIKTSFKGLVYVFLGNGTTDFHVPLDDSADVNWLSFDDWWNETVLVDQDQNVFTRKDIILAVSNKDGGAHVDPELPQTYAELSRGNSLGNLTKDGDGKWVPMRGAELGTIRQIGHELLKSIVPGYSKKPTVEGDGFIIAGMSFETPSVKSASSRTHRKVGRNESCPCGTGKKFKKCCLSI